MSSAPVAAPKTKIPTASQESIILAVNHELEVEIPWNAFCYENGTDCGKLRFGETQVVSVYQCALFEGGSRSVTILKGPNGRGSPFLRNGLAPSLVTTNKARLLSDLRRRPRGRGGVTTHSDAEQGTRLTVRIGTH